MDAGTALDPQAQASLAPGRSRSIAILLLGVFLLVAGVVAFSAYKSRADELQRFGSRFPGTITHRDSGSVDVEYWWTDGKTHTATIYVSSGSRFIPGDGVAVIVDPRDPEHVTLPGQRNLSPLLRTALGASLFGGAAGVYLGGGSLLRSSRQRRLLVSTHWMARDARWIAGAGGLRGSQHRLVVEMRTGEWREIRMRKVNIPRLAHSMQAAGGIEVAEGPRGHILFRVVGGDQLYAGTARSSMAMDDVEIVEPSIPLTDAQTRSQRWWLIGSISAVLALSLATTFVGGEASVVITLIFPVLVFIALTVHSKKRQGSKDVRSTGFD